MIELDKLSKQEKSELLSQDEVATWFRKAAEQGYAEAQYWLGLCYYLGDGVTQDYNQAVTWYRKAAEQGYANAQESLGVCYYFGWGVMQNESEALYWYRKAAEQDHAYAKEWVQCLENEGYSGHQKIKKCLY